MDSSYTKWHHPIQKKTPELTSWCPDFRQQSKVSSLYTTDYAGVADADFDNAKIPIPTTSIPDSNNVEFRGLEMDKIRNIVELCPNALHRVTYSPQKAEFVLRCEARCLELSKVVLGTNDRIPHQHIETLVTGMHPNRSVYDIAQAVQDYHSMRAILQEVIAQNGASHSVSRPEETSLCTEICRRHVCILGGFQLFLY